MQGFIFSTGVPGASGFSGFSGIGPSGFSGFSGLSGFSGTYSGYSGFSGESGFSGFSGTYSGFSGFSGVSGYSGLGNSGISGFSGIGGDAIFTSITTSDATPTTLTTIAIPDNTTVLIDATVSARETSGADRAGYIRRALVYRESAGIATLVDTVDTTLTRESDVLWDATISVSGNNALVEVTGLAGSTINWRCRYFTVNVS